jgi:hypothetical protein
MAKADLQKELAQLRTHFEKNARLRLEFLGSLSTLLRQHGVAVSDALLGQLKLSVDGASNSGGPIEKAGGPIEKAGGPIEKAGGPIEKAGGPIEKAGGPIQKAGGPIQKSAAPKPAGKSAAKPKKK